MKGMCITYEVEDSLYINLTNRCSNNCSFCIRNNGDGAYGSDSLWLLREPTVEEAVASVLSHDVGKYKEMVFCGYGEPSYRLREAREVALKLKSAYPDIRTRINTNGQSDLIFGTDTAPLYKDAFDSVSISLNAPTPERYHEICCSDFGTDALPVIIKFAENVKKYVQNVAFSVVRQTVSEAELAECFEISARVGVPLRVREYISE